MTMKTNNRVVPQQAKAGFVLAIEKLQQIAEDVWDWSVTSVSAVAKLNTWLAANPNYRLVETPRIESRLLSRQKENGIDVMTFSVSVSYLYEDISESVYDSRHTGVFEEPSEQRRTKEEWDEIQKEKEKETTASTQHAGSSAGPKPAAAAAAAAVGSSVAAEPGAAANFAPVRPDFARADARTNGAGTGTSYGSASPGSDTGGDADSDGSSSPAAERRSIAVHKFGSAADAVGFLARSGYSLPDSAIRTIAGITGRAAPSASVRSAEAD